MTPIWIKVLRALAAGAAVCASMPAVADQTLVARYGISMTGISVGTIDWSVTVGDSSYRTSASGGASGIFSVFFDGKGSFSTSGTVSEQRLLPRSFYYRLDDDDGPAELQMAFEGGAIRETVVKAPPPETDRVAITEANKSNAIDPLTALLVPADEEAEAQPQTSCRRVLMIYDGVRRYNLALSYKRTDKIAVKGGYSGPVVVCKVLLQPIAGHRSGSMLIKYVTGRQDVELWLAPFGAAPVLAPVRFVMPTLLGTVELSASRFDVTSTGSSRQLDTK